MSIGGNLAVCKGKEIIDNIAAPADGDDSFTGDVGHRHHYPQARRLTVQTPKQTPVNGIQAPK
jgi:hypothetical protein